MDTITHTLFGLSLYGATDKEKMDRRTKIAYLFTAVGASQIPDIDVISQAWDTEGLYQMWHRGITHSIFLTPLWALLFYILCLLFFKVKDRRLFFLGWIGAFIHDTSDLFNAWGTGYLEPFSEIRITFGTIPIIDFVFWVIIGGAYVLSRKKSLVNRPFYFRAAWVVIILHVGFQSLQGYYLYQKYSHDYGQVALSAGFIPTTFQVITKHEGNVTIFQDGLFQHKQTLYVLESQEEADLDRLFANNPSAKTLYQWSPFVVIVEDDNKIGVFDPRFYRNGQSFLFESIEH
ncbi:metal-dependent hydrolase [Mesobacillus maritimus]|uniref:Metal-dependent hydrolase n=1 Tax=Mesobacillus maritimus TaxID=1643336 RepID=A0ABS7K1I7_9BACI|nr:metal-dependent hydrolase [Mesobacillus maritimus]MBY0096117.1 metal-dependent hydrolase [Mesobacillus maritimus]